jgi:hypothetical protein
MSRNRKKQKPAGLSYDEMAAMDREDWRKLPQGPHRAVEPMMMMMMMIEEIQCTTNTWLHRVINRIVGLAGGNHRVTLIQ